MSLVPETFLTFCEIISIKLKKVLILSLEFQLKSFFAAAAVDSPTTSSISTAIPPKGGKSRRPQKRKSGQTGTHKPAKIAKSVSNLDIDRGTILNFKNRLFNEHLQLPKPITANISLDDLVPDTTLRDLSESNILLLLDQMVNGYWKPEICVFVVVEDGNKYRILNGNHRYQAMIRMKNSPNSSRRITSVKCEMYNEISYDQILLINAPTFSPLPHLPLTLLQKVIIFVNF